MCKKAAYVSVAGAFIGLVALMVFWGEAAQVQLSRLSFSILRVPRWSNTLGVI
jgi:hypothetical protein